MLIKLSKEVEKNKEKKDYRFYKNENFALISSIWCIVFLIIQFTIIILAGKETDLFNLNNLEIITMIIIAFLILLLSPKLLKIANEKITTTFSSFAIEPNIQEKREESRVKLKKWRIISYSTYAILFLFVLTMTHYSAFKETELGFEVELRNVLSEVLLTTEFNLNLGILLYVLYILMFTLFYTYVLILGDIFFSRLFTIFIPILITKIEEFDIFNGDNSMGFGDLGDIGKIIVFSSLTIVVLCIPKIFLSYSGKIEYTSVLDAYVSFIFVFALGWMFYLYQILKPLHSKMKVSKKDMMDKIVKEIDKESKRIFSPKTTNQRKSVQTKKLEIFLELRKQLITVKIWPISSTVIIVFISQCIALVIAIVSWLISAFGLL